MAPRAVRARGQRASSQAVSSLVDSLPPSILVQVLTHLSQTHRVHAAEVCRSWREATLSPSLWTSVKFILPSDDDEGTAEAFLSWLLPRASAVDSLTVDIQEATAPTSDFVVGVMSNLTAAMMAVRSSLRHLTLETPGCLVVGQWAAALQGLVTACFIGGDVHVKQGLGKLARLRELEFGSNNQELEVEAPACLPPGITHLSLEHCCLATVPDCITRLSKLRSLDLSQNTFVDDEGIETSALSALTGLECLKLANCRLVTGLPSSRALGGSGRLRVAAAPASPAGLPACRVPTELSSLRRLRILHMGGNLEREDAEEEDGEMLEAALRTLRNLKVLVISQCNVLLPDAVRRMGKLERLFVTSTPVVSLSSGPYCKSLRHLCVDWDVAFESAAMLEHCAVMEMLTLARPLRSDVPDGQVEERTQELTAVLLRHPSLKQVNIVAVEGRGLHFSISTMRFVLALQASLAPSLRLELIDSWDSDLVRIPNLLDFTE
ncbi:hypothetical protein CHLNCDRAFT_142486 [Chlorella variabilis]|uniref:F-box domain-containing protein n=1 Tax=Chlorella variabilis TaxID=554065 RepID=E1ZTR4_CHLVA|nr:hypothetical protein CHLNCDRAFT_142486 [Chlorella variabilis]EFN50760.1 hypothetical protein CHLNCDRAFT_142486 [Chlorella variabilis]|eukprot:XP_005842872.1 hypothetical protein CHLNCDRAFT_142486 [Chlorella variabilis]